MGARSRARSHRDHVERGGGILIPLPTRCRDRLPAHMGNAADPKNLYAMESQTR